MNAKERNIALRVDASSQIGTGHFMRCLTLADALKKRGAHTFFVSRYLPEYMRCKLTEKGHEFLQLDTVQNDSSGDELDHASWLGVNQAKDATDSIQALSGRDWDWLIVDHYALDSRWESLLRQTAKKIMAIDDIADRSHDCDLLLDQNLYADMETRYAGKVPEQCKLLLGPRYALLREEFRRLHECAKLRSGTVKRVLVFFGGIDADNYTGKTIEAISQTEVSELHVDVVIGDQHPSRRQIETECMLQGFSCHVQTDNMAELMAEADLAIGAGGGAIWERCCLGLPTLALYSAKNQQKQVRFAAQRGLLYSPAVTHDLIQVIRRHVLALIENEQLRQFISENGMQMVDGCGVDHVIANMECNNIEIRMAALDDSENLFNWRNHPSIRAVSRNTAVITWEDHQKWLAAILTDSKKMLLVGEDAGAPIGVVRFDVQGDEAEVSIYLIPEKASSGLGQVLLHSAELWLNLNRPDIRKIRAHVLGENERSLRFFSRAGYKMETAEYSKRLQ